MAKIVHFDISADDIDRAKRFYEGLFGWEFELFPGPTEYHLIRTAGLDGAPGLGGGMAKREQPGQGITNFVEVASIDDAIGRVVELGGQIIQPKTEIPGISFIAVAQDSEGNVVGLIEAVPGSPFGS